MFKDVYKIETEKVYRNQKIESDFIIIHRFSPNEGMGLECLHIKSIDLEDVIKLLQSQV